MMRRAALLFATAALVGCATAAKTPPSAMSLRFSTGFENPADFGGSYVTPQSEMTRHELSTEEVHAGVLAHKAWLTGIPPSTPEVDGPNHRGYPTVQFWKLPVGPLHTPCIIDLWVWLDVQLDAPGEWFSLATLSTSPPNNWGRVVTVNVGYEGWLHVFHVPNHGQGIREFQTGTPFPMREWVRVTTYIDFRSNGRIAVWQNGQLASVAQVTGGSGDLTEAHFGLYAPPVLTAGSVYNDDLTISCAA